MTPTFEDRSSQPAAAYRAPAAASEAELKEKGSRFLAIVLPVADEAAAHAELEELRQRHRDASHHCWAWRLGSPPRERSADAGEPAGTAGPPMLQVLRGAEMSDVLAVVVRWFGGTKLGKGGLARAYAGATREAIAHLATVRKVPARRLEFSIPYELVGAVKRLVRAPGVEIVNEVYGARAEIEMRVGIGELAAVAGALADLGIDPQIVAD